MSRLIRIGVAASALFAWGSIVASAQVPPPPACPEGQACGEPVTQHPQCVDRECNDCGGSATCPNYRHVANPVPVNTRYPPYCCSKLENVVCYVYYTCSTGGVAFCPQQCGTAFDPESAQNGPTKSRWVRTTKACAGRLCSD